MEVLLRSLDPHSSFQLAPEMSRFPPIRVEAVGEGKTEDCVRNGAKCDADGSGEYIGGSD